MGKGQIGSCGATVLTKNKTIPLVMPGEICADRLRML